MKRVRFMPMTALLLAAAISVLAAAEQQPNIIVLLADDEELCDHSNDPNAWKNLVSLSQYKSQPSHGTGGLEFRV
jgi:hypothetical protein